MHRGHEALILEKAATVAGLLAWEPSLNAAAGPGLRSYVIEIRTRAEGGRGGEAPHAHLMLM
eukprot:882613-Pelagomonas_calceolata.AAC.2